MSAFDGVAAASGAAVTLLGEASALDAELRRAEADVEQAQERLVEVQGRWDALVIEAGKVRATFETEFDELGIAATPVVPAF